MYTEPGKFKVSVCSGDFSG